MLQLEKKMPCVLDSLVFESGTSWASHCWFRFFQPAMVQIDSFPEFSGEEMWQSKLFCFFFWVCPQRCNKKVESDPEFQEVKQISIPFLSADRPCLQDLGWKYFCDSSTSLLHLPMVATELNSLKKKKQKVTYPCVLYRILIMWSWSMHDVQVCR